MNDRQAADHVVGLFYEGVLDAARWRDAMRAFADFADSRSAVSLTGAPASGETPLVETEGQSPETMRDYMAYYIGLDPLLKVMHNFGEAQWINDWRAFGRDYAHTEYYNDFILPHGNHALIATKLHERDGVLMTLSVQRAPGQPVFDAADEEKLNPLLPHLQRAARMRLAALDLQRRAALGAAALDHVLAPVLLTDADGRVRLANQAAERLCRDGRALRIADGKLRARHEPAPLQQALAQAAKPTAGVRGSWLRVRGADATPDCVVAVAPLGAASPLAADWQRPMVVVMVTQIGTAPQSVEALLCSVFGLTRAEARLVDTLSSGVSLVEAAQRLGVQVSTLRTQLSSVFYKLGVRRQAQLMQLVATLQAVATPLRSPPGASSSTSGPPPSR